MSQPEPQPQPQAPHEQGAQPAPAVDLQQLAERVYRLMLADLRMEQARGARPARRKGR